MNNLKRITFSIAAAVAISAGAISPAMAQSSMSSMSSSSPIGNNINKNPVVPIEETDEEREFKMGAETLRLLNEYRVNNGLDPVIVDPTLSDLAHSRAEEMSNTKYLSHLGSGMRENFAYESNVTLGSTFNLWKNTHGYDMNMLRPEVTSVGIGVKIDDNGAAYSQMILR